MLEQQGCELSLQAQVRLLGLNRSGLYYRPVGPSPEELDLRRRIDELYTKWPFFGSRRITAMLQRDGLVVNRKAVQPTFRG